MLFTPVQFKREMYSISLFLSDQVLHITNISVLDTCDINITYYMNAVFSIMYIAHSVMFCTVLFVWAGL